jgi:hypothetical protein
MRDLRAAADDHDQMPELREPAEPIEDDSYSFSGFPTHSEFSGNTVPEDRFVGFDSPLPDSFPASYAPSSHWLDNISVFGGIDGSKQPQDFGVNANLGLQGHVNAGFALDEDSGLGLQLGTGIVGSQNAVRVYELLGEARNRVQSFTTAGLFQRSDSGFLWAIGHDFLIEESYDTFTLSQWRGRIGYDADDCNQFGVTAQLRAVDDSGDFNGGLVSLRTINQASIYWRHVWESQTQTTIWVGLADGHGENNAVVGPAPAKDTVPLLGADFLAPLNDHLALYGETNLIMPADTGTVDAFLGFQWYPGGGARRARRTAFAPVLPVASPTNVSVDLR